MVALAAGSAAIGASPIFVRLSELGPIATAFHRMLWALPLLWIWTRFERRGAPANAHASAKHASRIVLCGSLFVGDLIFWHWSILYTTIANATLFANFAPLVVTLGAWLILKEQITSRFLLGMAIALIGAGLLVGASLELGRRYVVGDSLGLITAVFFGSYVIAIATLRRVLPASVIMFWSSLVTCLGLLVATLLAGEGIIPRTMHGFAVLLGLAWMSQAVGQGMIAYALGHVPASVSSLVILIEALTAAGLAWLILAEPLGHWQAFGGAAILTGILIARRGQARFKDESARPGVGPRHQL